MKITLFIGSLSGGGAERVTCNLANYLSKVGHDVNVMVVSEDSTTYYLNKEIAIYSLSGRFKKNNPLISVYRFFRFITYLIKNKCDTYIVMLPRTTILLLKYNYLTKARIIATQRIMPSSLNISNQNLLKKYSSKADGWVFQTEEQFEWFKKCNLSSKTIIIPNAINADFFHPIYQGEKRPVIVTAGRMTEQKNQHLLLKAFAQIKSYYPNYTIVIYGKGPKEESLREITKDLGLSEIVKMPGYTNNIGDCIKDATLFVLSSNYEGMPNALMEAMALGLPCISTDCDGGGARFLIEDGVNGLLVPKNDVDAMAKAMKRILDNPDFASSLGNNAHKICERLAPEKIYGEWELFIEKIVECD